MYVLSRKYFFLAFLAVLAAVSSGCIKKKSSTAVLLRTEDAEIGQLKNEVDRYSQVSSMRAKMYLRFEDNSFAQFGSKEVYREADGEIVVQRPANILMKVQVPFVKSDIAQMSSDGHKFRVAILQDGGDGRYKKFVIGTNDADYSKLQKKIDSNDGGDVAVKTLSAFAEIRPQHFTDAMLVRPIDNGNVYTQSTIFQTEDEKTEDKKSIKSSVTRGYYLLDEYSRAANGDMRILRRFWFDRVGKVRLARQQLFDAKGEIASDIVYGREGDLSTTAEYKNLPLQITVTRPQEKYSMTLRYQSPAEVAIGQTFPLTAFVLQNSWNLEELDLDKKLQEVTASQSVNSANINPIRVQ